MPTRDCYSSRSPRFNTHRAHPGTLCLAGTGSDGLVVFWAVVATVVKLLDLLDVIFPADHAFVRWSLQIAVNDRMSTVHIKMISRRWKDQCWSAGRLGRVMSHLLQGFIDNDRITDSKNSIKRAAKSVSFKARARNPFRRRLDKRSRHLSHVWYRSGIQSRPHPLQIGVDIDSIGVGSIEEIEFEEAIVMVIASFVGFRSTPLSLTTARLGMAVVVGPIFGWLCF
jgi:hypothetical protein